MSPAPPPHQVLENESMYLAEFHFKAMWKASLRSRPSSYGRQPQALKIPESNPIPSPNYKVSQEKQHWLAFMWISATF